MRQHTLNLVIVAAALAFALGLGAGIQELFRLLLPTVSNRQLGVTDIGTYFGIPAMGLAFIAYGYVVPRWTSAPFPLGWLLLPMVVLYVIAMTQLPWLHSFESPYFVIGAVIHTAFFSSLVACALGYMIQRKRRN